MEQSRHDGSRVPGSHVQPAAREAFPHHVFWYVQHPEAVDLTDPATRTWYVGAILREGRAEDVARLDVEEIRRLLPQLRLPQRVRDFWEWYLSKPGGSRQSRAGHEVPGSLKPRKPQLTPLQRHALEHLVLLPDMSRFVLGSGTALAAFYLHHRCSADLDFFTSEKAMVLPHSRLVEEALAEAGLQVQPILRTQSFVRMEVRQGPEQLRLDLALDAPFRFAPPEQVKLGNGALFVENLQDLAVNKVLALFGRAEARDFIDVYALRPYFSLRQLAQWAAQKDPGFDLYWFCIALRQVENITLQGLELYAPVSLDAMRAWFTEQAHDLCADLQPR